MVETDDFFKNNSERTERKIVGGSEFFKVRNPSKIPAGRISDSIFL